MDLSRFLDLYVSETTEHRRLLHRSLLALEREQHGPAIDDAFRAAHTLKSLSAAMGYTLVADLSHRLEDRLSEIRTAAVIPSADIIDELLAAADSLDEAITAAVASVPAASGEAADGVGARAAPPVPAVQPQGTAAVALVRLREDAAIKGARAMLIMRSLGDIVLGSDPVEFADDFAGDFHVFFSATVDRAAAAAAIQAAGDVASVAFIEDAGAVDAAVQGNVPKAGARHMRVDAGRLDRLAERISELTVLHGRLMPDLDDRSEAGVMLARMSNVLAELQHEALSLRMVPLRESFERLPRVVRDAARATGREVDLVIAGEDVELDRAIVDEIGDPLIHLLRNAVDHGIEEPAARVAAGKPARGRIEVRAERERSSVRIIVQDDGAGINAERVVARAREAGLLGAATTAPITREEMFRLLSHPGFSTADHVSTVSGRGVGMDVVATRIRTLGGAVELNTVPGSGTTFGIRLPLALSLVQALRVRVGDEEYAIPLTHLAEAVELNGNVVGGAVEMVEVRAARLPLVRMRRLLHVATSGEEQTAVIAEAGGRRAAIGFDELLGREQILIKGFDHVHGLLPYFAGATLLADGRPALVLDPISVL